MPGNIKLLPPRLFPKSDRPEFRSGSFHRLIVGGLEPVLDDHVRLSLFAFVYASGCFCRGFAILFMLEKLLDRGKCLAAPGAFIGCLRGISLGHLCSPGEGQALRLASSPDKVKSML